MTMVRTIATLTLTIAAITSPVTVAIARAETVTVELPICAEEDCSDLVGIDTGVWIDPDTGTAYVVIVD